MNNTTVHNPRRTQINFTKKYTVHVVLACAYMHLAYTVCAEFNDCKGLVLRPVKFWGRDTSACEQHVRIYFWRIREKKKARLPAGSKTLSSQGSYPIARPVCHNEWAAWIANL